MNAESVKARLKNFAKDTGHTFQEALTYYGLERTIYRISVSEYAEHFILKGGIFLYAIFDRNYERATTDVDLLARRISNVSEEMKAVFQKILSHDANDALCSILTPLQLRTSRSLRNIMDSTSLPSDILTAQESPLELI